MVVTSSSVASDRLEPLFKALELPPVSQEMYKVSPKATVGLVAAIFTFEGVKRSGLSTTFVAVSSLPTPPRS